MNDTAKPQADRSPRASKSSARANSGQAKSDAKTSPTPSRSSHSETEDQLRGLSILPPEIECPREIRIPQWFDPAIADGMFKAALGRATLGVSPAGLADCYFNWFAHLALSPGKQLNLAEDAFSKQLNFVRYASSLFANPNARHCAEPLPHDHRFDGDEWQQWPFNLIHQAFLLTQQWWNDATNDVNGVSEEDERVVSFVTRQVLDHFAPCNFIHTNPKVLHATLQKGGQNLADGLQNFMVDVDRYLANDPPVGAEDYKPGEQVAVTPGKVVYRNRLIELIQYEPQTDKVRPEPILIVPAWIMKYYILDLSPENSLVRYLVEQGYTVFCISWRNPGREDRDLGMEDYRNLGVMAALDAVNAIVPDRKVHAVGYCIGGTLLSISASYMAQMGDDRFGTITLFATQVDFDEAGELMLFVSESEVAYLENIMWAQGYLDSHQMAGAFQLLRSNDLIWSRYIEEYLMGERQGMFDLMAWNADGTRLPYRMHSEYLRKLLLKNEFAEGHYRIDGKVVSITDVRQPLFCVSTEKDHIAPWHSVYKIHLLADTDITFVLTNGGHNAGIVSEPGHEGRHFRIREQSDKDKYLDAQTWQREAEQREGSWWPAWTEWLASHSGAPAPPPSTGAAEQGYRPMEDAPGTYVHQR